MTLKTPQPQPLQTSKTPPPLREPAPLPDGRPDQREQGPHPRNKRKERQERGEVLRD